MKRQLWKRSDSYTEAIETGRVTVDQHLASGGTMGNAGNKADTNREGKPPTQKRCIDTVVRMEIDDLRSDGECRTEK